jgi:hypothetical protein
MRTISPMLIAVALQGLVLAGCAGSSDPLARTTTATPAVSAAATPAVLSCGKNEQVCFSCDGSRQFCAEFCLECTLPAADPSPTTPSEVAATTCSPPQRTCLSCDGTTQFCAIRCPECPPPLAPGSESPPATLALARGGACAQI